MRKILEQIMLNNKYSNINISERLATYILGSNIHRNADDTSDIQPKVVRYSNTRRSPRDENNKYKIKGTDRFRTYLLIIILFFCSLTSMILRFNATRVQEVQTGIADEIIRFHVIANSDANEDQELKLTVKTTLVKTLSPLLRDTASKAEARTILTEQMDSIKHLAEETIRHNGYNYDVTVSIENVYFPLKIYGDYTFPAGYYEALRVQIGKAEGKNWWCVMFPPLCFVDETYNVVDEDSDAKLKDVLTDDEYDALFSKKTPVKVKFKLWEAIKDLFN